ncbi:DUF6998 domain-containing protein [Prosthecobacter vanneervenii]|uniref:DUF6998 domain-containing protein n=1 Tax=Prosthecobacter vanneervenii TaxID=48466 RepID=A0A7W7Y8L1_9BACT|nr:hypothetical protein [Prosthecobacter vanneervenii]MBB5031495.1 hypothetical protein [Prosthecobacter vanneervenii]
MAKQSTNQDRLNALAQHSLPEPFHSHLEQVHKICRQMRDHVGLLGMNLDFTPDGRFVGDMGELIAALKFGVTIHKSLKGGQDGVCSVTGKSVEVKLRTQANSIIWVKGVPDILLVIYLCPTSLRWGVVYNGPGTVIQDTQFAKYNERHGRYETSIPKMLAASEAMLLQDQPTTLILHQVH